MRVLLRCARGDLGFAPAVFPPALQMQGLGMPPEDEQAGCGTARAHAVMLAGAESEIFHLARKRRQDGRELEMLGANITLFLICLWFRR